MTAKWRVAQCCLDSKPTKMSMTIEHCKQSMQFFRCVGRLHWELSGYGYTRRNRWLRPTIYRPTANITYLFLSLVSRRCYLFWCFQFTANLLS